MANRISSGGAGSSFGAKAEVSVSTAADDLASTLGANLLLTSPLLTVPSIADYYKLKAVTYKTGLVQSGNVIVGVAKIDNDPPVGVGLMVLAKSAINAMGAPSSTLRIELEEGILIGKGTVICAFIMTSDAIGTIRGITQGVSNVSKAVGSFNAPAVETSAWGTSTITLFATIHMIPFSV